MTQLTYTIEKAAQACSIGKTKLYQAIRENKLRAKKFGHRTIILKSDLEKFLSELTDFHSEENKS